MNEHRPNRALATLLLTFSACIIELPADDTDGSTGDQAGTSTSTSAASSAESGSTDGRAGSSSESSTGILGDCGTLANMGTHAGTIEAEVWSAGIHDVENVTIVGAVTVEPCAVLRMAPSASINVRDGGSLALDGTDEGRIRVTSANRAPGSWNTIDFGATSNASGNRLVNVDVEYGGGGNPSSMVWVDGGTVEIRGSTFTNAAGDAIRAESGSSLASFEENSIFDNLGAPLRLHPSVVADVGPGVYAPNETDGIIVTDGSVEADAVWNVVGAPLLVSDISVGGEDLPALLELGPGTAVHFSASGGLRVLSNGGLHLAGTRADPIVVRSVASRPSAGDWESIRIEGGSLAASNRFEHVTLRDGGGDDRGAVFIAAGATLAMTDCRIEDSASAGVFVQGGGRLAEFARNTVVGNVGAALELPAAAVGDLGEGTYSPNGIDAIVVEGDVVDRDATWRAHDAPYHLLGTTRFDSEADSAVLTVREGARLLLGPGAQLRLQANAGLQLQGTDDARIQLASLLETPAAGDWDYVMFDTDSADLQNVWSHVDVAHGGGGGSQFAHVWIRPGAALSLEDVTFESSGTGCDVRVDAGGTLNLTDATPTECG